MPVDIFGDCTEGSRGPRGRPGPPGLRGKRGATGHVGPPGKKGDRGEKGDSSISLVRWFPSRTIEWFRRDKEECCFYFKDKNDFLLEGERIIGFRSHTAAASNAISQKDPVKMRILNKQNKGYCAEFSNSLLKVKNIDMARTGPSYSVLVLTFKVSEKPKTKQYILSNISRDRAILLNTKGVEIYGTKDGIPIIISYELHKWNTIFVQWSDDYDTGYIYFENVLTKFKTGKSISDSSDIYIGAKPDGGFSFKGCLAAIDMYSTRNRTDKVFPDEFRNLIINDHLQGPKDSVEPIGKKGKDGFDICKWFPVFTLEMFRKYSENCCLLITDPKTDLQIKKDSNIIRWITKSDEKKDAVSVIPSKSYRNISQGRWGLDFNKSLYNIKDVTLTPAEEYCVLACVTFKLDAVNEQVIVTDFDNNGADEVYRGITASRSYIYIWGIDNESKYISIPHQTPENCWITVLVEWLTDGKYNRIGTYNINNFEKEGSFKSNEKGLFTSENIYLGALCTNKKPLSGAISGLEILHSLERAPDNIKKLIIEGQFIERN